VRGFNDKSTIAGGSRPRVRPAAQSEAMRNQRKNKHHSPLRDRLKREDAADFAKLTPAERLQAALDLSDFCLMLAAKVREADAQLEGRVQSVPQVP